MWFKGKMELSLMLLLFVVGALCQEHVLTYHLLEEEQVGTVIANIVDDLTRNFSFTETELLYKSFSIIPKDSQWVKKFSINDDTGVIKTRMKLDRETECEMKKECELSFDVEISDSEPDSVPRIIRIVIVLEDINDNAPTFPERFISRNISESAPVGQIIPVPPAIDKDMTGNNSVRTYLMFPSDGPFALSVVKNPSGIDDIGIEVKSALNREDRDFYRLTIIAKDGGSPRKSGSVDINITVTDINDNTPNFSIKTFTIIVQEDISVGQTILTLSAEDDDIGANSELLYKISPRSPSKALETFAIEIDTGELYPIKNLDYENEKQYQFRVMVHDNGFPVKSSEALVIVNVTDVNDNAPQIFFKQSTFNLSEAVGSGTFSTIFSFVDADSGKNAEVSCYISDPRFRLENLNFNYRKIYLQKQLDYEQNKVIEVNVTCNDHGTPQLKNATSFTVLVQDVNDNPPFFPNTTMFANIPENNQVGDLIMILAAEDNDGPGNNIPLYRLTEQSPWVTIDQHTGEMRAKVVFDCESQSSFEVKVMAFDSQNSSLKSSAIVVVTVEDRNDMPPRFTQKIFNFNITENLPRNSLCGKLTAVDLDSTNNFMFLFKEVDSVRSLFKLDSKTGEVRTARKLSREMGIQYSFDVEVVDPDNKSFKNTATVNVYVMEDKDKPPVITFPNRLNNSASILYDAKIGSLIATIRAFDDGRDGQIMLTFTIEHGNDKTLFSLNPISGELTLARGIGATDVGNHEILIAVHDNGVPRHTTYAYLTINIANSTASATFNYLPIVVSLVFVTIIVGLAIFLGLMCMRRRDRKRKERQKTRDQDMKVFAVSKDNDSDNSPRYASHNTLSHKPDAVARMKVFNDIERDNYKFSEDLYETSFQSEEDDKISDLSHTRDFYIHGSSTFDPGLPRKYQKYRHNAIFNKVDDGASDISVATDSGRGASDEDINSNRALMFLHSDSVFSTSSLV